MKEKFKNSFKYLYDFLFPVIHSHSLNDLLYTNVLFDNYKTPSSWFQHIFVSITYLMTMVSGFRIQIAVDFHPLSARSLGEVGDRVITFGAFVCMEIIIHRIWLYMLIHKYHKVEQVPFVKLLHKIDNNLDKSILKFIKVISSEVQLGGYGFQTIMLVTECLNSKDICQFMVSVFYYIGFIQVIRMGITDSMILYTLTAAGFEVIKTQMDSFEKSIDDYKDYPCNTYDLMDHYYEMVLSIEQLNSITKILMSSNDITVIPCGSAVIFLMLVPDSNPVYVAAKYIVLGAIIVFTLRGYILVAMLSYVDTRAKRIYLNINSIIFRVKRRRLIDIYRLKLIMEDIACIKSHVVVREFSGRVTQMDVYNSIISTISFLTLLFSFYEATSN